MKKALMCEYLNGIISLNNTCGTKLSDYKTCQWFKMNSRKKFGEIQEHYLEHIEIVFTLWPPKSEWLLISFHKIKLEPYVKVRKANGMITKQRALIVKRILLRNQRKSMEKSMENIQSDFRIKNVRNSQELIKLTIRLNVSLK